MPIKDRIQYFAILILMLWINSQTESWYIEMMTILVGVFTAKEIWWPSKEK